VPLGNLRVGEELIAQRSLRGRRRAGRSALSWGWVR